MLYAFTGLFPAYSYNCTEISDELRIKINTFKSELLVAELLKVPFTAAGRARIETFEDNPLKLQMSKRFSAVQIDETPELAQETMVMNLDCNASNSVQDMFKSLKDTLGN